MHLRGDWVVSVLVFYVYSAAVQTMPKPRPDERWYNWAYSFLQVLGANLKDVFGKETALITTTKITGDSGETKIIEKIEEVVPKEEKK